jgi:hypothetical protein
VRFVQRAEQADVRAPAQQAAARSAGSEPKAAVVPLEGRRAVRPVQRVAPVVRARERPAAAELDGLLPAVQRAPAALQPRAASVVLRAVSVVQRREFLPGLRAA